MNWTVPPLVPAKKRTEPWADWDEYAATIADAVGPTIPARAGGQTRWIVKRRIPTRGGVHDGYNAVHQRPAGDDERERRHGLQRSRENDEAERDAE